MYSFQAVADMTQVHTGFYIICALIAVFWPFATWGAFKERDNLWLWFFSTLFLGAVLYVSYLCSFHDVAPKNEVVIGTYEGPTAEVSAKEITGKMPRTEITHLLYGRFRVPEGIVTLPIQAGTAIPPRVVLYKN